MRRKLLFILLGLAACALIALVVLPWWLGAALSVAGGRFGLTFAEYRRIGYSRFALEKVVLKNASVDVEVSRIELPTALWWLARNPGPVSIDEWNVRVHPRSPVRPSAKPSGWVPLKSVLNKVAIELEKRLPPATARQGAVTWPGGRIEVAGAVWTKGNLKAASIRWREIAGAAEISHDAKKREWTVLTRDIGGMWTATLRTQGAGIAGEGTWSGQPWTAVADFAPTGWLPVGASAEAREWSFLGSRFKLGNAYATVGGNARVAWKESALSVDMEIAGEPLEGGDAPPLAVSLHGSGGLDRLNLDRLEVKMPGVSGRLSEPVVIARDGKLLSGVSRFELTADLAQQPWLKNGRGIVNGSVNVTPRADGLPLVEATLTTADAAFADWRVAKADIAVRMEWPQVTVTRGEIELAGGDRLAVGGAWNATTRTLAGGRMSGQISRATTAHWLPAEAGFDSLEIEATAAGTWPGIVHQGTLKANALHVAPLHPLTVAANWRGTDASLELVTLDAAAGTTKVHLSGSVGAAPTARVSELVLTQAGEERLRLVRPVVIEKLRGWMITHFELKGPDGDIAGHVEWGESGRLVLHATNFSSVWLADLVTVRGPVWRVATLDIQGSWDRGPLTFTATGAATVDLAAGRQSTVMLAAQGDGGGVQLTNLRASMDGNPVMAATGRLPAALWPAEKPWLRFDESAALALDIDTEPHALFWEQFTAMTGLLLMQPEIDLKLAGTLKKTTGEGRISIAKIGPGGAAWARSLPDIDNLQARLTGDRNGLALETLTAKVAGQDIRASGRLPVKEWATLVSDPLALAGVDGEARIEIPDADMAALTRYAPAYLAPVGKLQIDVALERGGQFKGVVRLKGAATRPLGPLGILQEIGAEILLDGRTIEFKEVRATTGGQPVTLSGTVQIPAQGEPRLNLALRGERLPFVRQTGLLVRGDLDLKVVSDDAGVTRITGRTVLRDSLFLMDVRGLIPSGGSRSAPGRRPPYFSVGVAPFNAWLLDVEVRGDRFLRLRTPVFNGLASANFRLRGTLGDPRATGDVTINQGTVLLPFANFTVRQGSVRLTEADPFEPRISVIGVGRRYGYDLRMEITGTAEKPRLTFTSTPTLESDQVLLMVMAGEAPQNEANYTGGERAARLGAYLGQSLIGQFSADPSAADRISINVGERVSRQGKETYGVEYTLDPRWSLVGEYDEFDEYNLGVKWRVLKAEKETAEKKEAPDANK